jgi:hypothetical protein
MRTSIGLGLLGNFFRQWLRGDRLIERRAGRQGREVEFAEFAFGTGFSMGSRWCSTSSFLDKLVGSVEHRHGVDTDLIDLRHDIRIWVVEGQVRWDRTLCLMLSIFQQ